VYSSIQIATAQIPSAAHAATAPAPAQRSNVPPASFVPAPLRAAKRAPIATSVHHAKAAVPAITGAGAAPAAPASTDDPILTALQRVRLDPLRVQQAPRSGAHAVSAATTATPSAGGQGNQQQPPARRTTSAAESLAAPCTTIRKLLIYGPSSSPSGLAENTPCTTYTAWDETTWASKTTADFAAFDAIVFGDEPPCDFVPDIWATAVGNAAVWSAAVKGNVVILGTDPDFHDKPDLVQNAVNFADSGNGTGLYVALGCAYWDNSVPTPTSVPLLSQFGNFVVRDVVNCPNNAHIVAHNPVLDSLSDAYLSNWSCSAHEGFDTWPSSFTPLTIIEDAETSFSFVAGDGSSGLVYMLASGNVGGDMPQDQQRNSTNCTCSTSAQPQSGEPFNTRTGNVWTQGTDLDLPGAGPALSWQRTYNSQATGDADQPGALGWGWMDSFATHVITATMSGGELGLAIIVSPTGDRSRFQDLGGGQYRSFPGVNATLAGNDDGTFTETFPDQRATIFNAQGQATAMSDGHGGQLNLTYGSGHLTEIVDAGNAARYLAIDYAADGVHIADVRDPAGREVQYSYDGNGDLHQVTDVMGRTITYTYNTHLLTEIDNNLGQAELRNSYDTYGPTGKVVAQTLQDGRQLAISYGQDATTITTTGSDGT
jgi:YD repeat-containing protein